MLNGLVTPMAKQPFKELTRAVTIRELNDQMRRRLPIAQHGSRVVLTSGVQRLSDHELTSLIAAIRDFAAFSPDNDPHGEHDFGSIEQNGTRFLWKLDYFDVHLQLGSPDPSNPLLTTRVLTIMRADEY